MGCETKDADKVKEQLINELQEMCQKAVALGAEDLSVNRQARPYSRHMTNWNSGP